MPPYKPYRLGGGVTPLEKNQVPICPAFSGIFCYEGGGSNFFGTQNNLSENIFLPKSYADDV
jgi:hypothetical protein